MLDNINLWTGKPEEPTGGTRKPTSIHQPATNFVSKDDLKQHLDDYRKFAFASSMIYTCLAFTLGTAFGKIVNSLVNNLVMPIVNYGINATGTDWRLLSWTPLKGMKLELGAFVGSSIDFLVITIICFTLWKVARKYASATDPLKS